MTNPSILQKAMKILILVNTAITNLRLYPPTSTMIAITIDRLHQAFLSVFEDEPSLIFAEAERNLLICGEPLNKRDLERPQVRAFLELLLHFGIRSITFEKGLEKEKLLGFLPILAKKPEAVRSEGGLQKALDDACLTHILLDKKIYIARDESQQIIASLDISDDDIIRYTVGNNPDLNLDLQNIKEMAKDSEWATQIFQKGLSQLVHQKGALPNKQLSEKMIRMIGFLDRIVDPNDQERLAGLIANAIAGLDVDLASSVLNQDIGNLLGGQIFRHVVDQMDEEKFAGVAEGIRSLESGRAGGGAYDRLMASDKGKELKRKQEEQAVREKDEKETRLAQIKREISPFLQRDENAFLNKPLMASLPDIAAQLKTYGEQLTADALFGRIAEALLSRNQSVRDEASAALVRMIGDLPPERQRATIREWTGTFLKWITLETSATSAYEKIGRRLKDQVEEAIRERQFADNIPVLDLFHRIEAGVLDKNDTAQAIAADIIRELAAPETLELLFREFSEGEEKDQEDAGRILGRLGDVSRNRLLDILRDHDDSKERIRILNIFAEIGKPGILVLRGRIIPDEPWYFLRNLAYILGRIPSEATASALHPLLLNKEGKVRQEALKSLARAGGSEKGPVLLSILPTADELFKLDVVEMLGNVKYAGAVPALVELLKTRPLITPAARIDLEEKICTALGKIGSPEVVPVLTEISKPKGFFIRSVYPDKVRNAAAKALASLGNVR